MGYRSLGSLLVLPGVRHRRVLHVSSLADPGVVMMGKLAKVEKLQEEIRSTVACIVFNMALGIPFDPEDIVVLRGSTEALIELAEEQ